MSNDSEANPLDIYSAEFDAACQSRHDIGAKEYGPIAFLQNDVMVMMLEELVDISNYARYQYIKVRMLQESIKEQMGFPKETDPQVGPQSFIPGDEA